MGDKSVVINERAIGVQYPPYVIAELSANHNGDIQRAYKIMEEAKKAGADAIKLQTYTPDTITLNYTTDDFMIKGGLWDGQSLYQLYTHAHMPWAWHKPLFVKAKQLGITIFSSPFVTTAIDLLEDLNAPAYKIASFEVIDLPLIAYAAKTQKPLIISTGMANQHEIADAVATAREHGCQDLIVLRCVSGYPAPPQQYHLRTIPDIAERFGVVAGLSDHTLDNATAIAAVALGAAVIEKHVTLDRNGGGADDSFSLEPAQLQQLCIDVKTAWQALGRVNYAPVEAEKPNQQFRRSLYFVKALKAGELITPDHVRSVRPGFGLPPKMLNQVLGAVAATNIAAGTAVSAALFHANSHRSDVHG